jgi:hypothetical protein
MQTYTVHAREHLLCHNNRAPRASARSRAQVSPRASSINTTSTSSHECSSSGVSLDRRQLLGAAAAVTLLSGRPAEAVQGLTAGRIPGEQSRPTCPCYTPALTRRHHRCCNLCTGGQQPQLHQSVQTAACLLPLLANHAGITGEADAAGFYTYTRPEGKSGGHGIGWSEVPRYSFKVPGGWEETPVSIADLGGTEVRQGGDGSS